MCPELGQLEEPTEIGGQAGLTLCNEGVIELCGRNEGGSQNAFGREGARIVEGIVKRDEL